jgi:hypothetical protein
MSQCTHCHFPSLVQCGFCDAQFCGPCDRRTDLRCGTPFGKACRSTKCTYLCPCCGQRIPLVHKPKFCQGCADVVCPLCTCDEACAKGHKFLVGETQARAGSSPSVRHRNLWPA